MLLAFLILHGIERFGTERAELYMRSLVVIQNDAFINLCSSGASVMTTASCMVGITYSADFLPNMICTQKLLSPLFLTLDIQELIRVSMERCDLMTKQIDVMIKKVEGVAIKSLLDNA